jgi:parallel beta-helix repeat protein
MIFGKTLRVACAAVAALSPLTLLAQVTNPPLAPVPSYMVNPGATGPFVANQPVVPPANNGQFIVPDTYSGAPVMGPGGVCPPVCPPMCGPVCPPICPQPCPPANFDPYYSPLPGAAAPVTTMPGGINWNNTAYSGVGITPRVGGGYLDGEHVGLTDGYIWLEGWVPVWQTPGQNVFFLDVNTLKYNDGHDQWGFNGHGGYRWFNCTTNRIWGFYLGYDYRDVGPAEFEQISGGVESLGALWDFRGNAYWVFGNDSTQIEVSDPFFIGNNLAVNTTNIDAYSGFDVEAGRNFTANNPTFDLRGFIGGYGFFNDNAEDIWGGRARLEARWWNRFTLEAGVNYDQTFDTTVWVAGSILFGGSQTAPAGCGCPPTIVDRLADPLYKNRHIVVNERVEQELIINPADDEPLFFLHIDSNNAAPGTGTFEDPFATLAAAEAANNADVDILLAHGGSVFTGEEIDLNFANQRFLGDGDAVRHTVDSQFGTLTLPRANGLAAQPIIQDSPDDAIRINAANVEVSGFDIRNPVTDGIEVNGVQGFNINRNLISGADANDGTDGDGIQINIAGIADATGNISDNLVAGGNENGIVINTGAGSFAGTVIDNTSIGNDEDGFLVGEISGGTFTGNTASGNLDDGFDIDTISGGTFSGNAASGNGNHGFEIDTISGGTISNNSATANSVNGFLIGGISDGTFSGNSAINNATGNGFGIVTQSGGTVSGNSAFGNNGDGFFFSAITGGLVDGNTSNNNADDGFDINAAFSGGQFNNNTANNNVDQGYEVTGAVAPATAANNVGAGNAGGDTFTFP